MPLKPGDRNVVDNLRRRWPAELAKIDDEELAREYDYFSQSELYGNNDERFLEYIFLTDG